MVLFFLPSTFLLEQVRLSLVPTARLIDVLRSALLNGVTFSKEVRHE